MDRPRRPTHKDILHRARGPARPGRDRAARRACRRRASCAPAARGARELRARRPRPSRQASGSGARRVPRARRRREPSAVVTVRKSGPRGELAPIDGITADRRGGLSGRRLPRCRRRLRRRLPRARRRALRGDRRPRERHRDSVGRARPARDRRFCGTSSSCAASGERDARHRPPGRRRTSRRRPFELFPADVEAASSTRTRRSSASRRSSTSRATSWAASRLLPGQDRRAAATTFRRSSP